MYLTLKRGMINLSKGEDITCPHCFKHFDFDPMDYIDVDQIVQDNAESYEDGMRDTYD